MAAFRTAPWSLISGTLGAVCLLLTVTLGILLKNCSDCCSCREKWIGYRCNCYFLSNEQKSWAESRDFCASQNSSLLQLESRDELGFANFLQYFYWIGLSYNDARGAWLWEDGSALSSNLFSFNLTPNPEGCILYASSGDVLYENCVEKNWYICKQRLI